jgi:hypothetical protein
MGKSFLFYCRSNASKTAIEKRDCPQSQNLRKRQSLATNTFSDRPTSATAIALLRQQHCDRTVALALNAKIKEV